MFAARNMMFASGLSDPDAAAYIAAVQAVSSMPYGNQLAINAFFVGCKADGIWTAIKASCILAGADTLTGALVPLVGTAPTNNNFVSGDYSRTLGLLGDGSTKYLNSNRNNNADPQNNHHLAVQVNTVAPSLVGTYIGAGAVTTGASMIAPTTLLRSRSRVSVLHTSTIPTVAGFAGISRSSVANYTLRGNATSSTVTATSETSLNENLCIFARIASGSPADHSNARLSFYSIGESLNLALLDARLATLMAALS